MSCVGLEGRARWQKGIVVSRARGCLGNAGAAGVGREREREGGERGRVLGVAYARCEIAEVRYIRGGFDRAHFLLAMNTPWVTNS